MFELAPSLPESKTGAVVRRVLRTAPRVATGAFFVFVGYTKFDDDPKGWAEIFEQIGLGQWFRIFTGVVQTLGGVLLVVRRTVTIGAVLTGSTMLGAALVDIFVLGYGPIAIVPLLLLFLVATVWVTSD